MGCLNDVDPPPESIGAYEIVHASAPSFAREAKGCLSITEISGFPQSIR